MKEHYDETQASLILESRRLELLKEVSDVFNSQIQDADSISEFESIREKSKQALKTITQAESYEEIDSLYTALGMEFVL